MRCQLAGLLTLLLFLSLGQPAIASSSSNVEPNPTRLADTPVPANRFYTMQPCRLLDTRDLTGPTGGQPLVGGVARTFALARHCRLTGVTSAVSINVTVVGPTFSGNLRVYQAGIAEPATSIMNFGAGQVRSNGAMVSVAADGQASLTVRPDMPGGTVHLILDVNGYYAPTGPWPPQE